ncbi:MAG: hypothetical protein QM751_03265 [Paludibacteraceae bacterium]
MQSSHLVNPDSTHYKLPQNVGIIIKHTAEFLLRSLENGRFFVWILFAFVAVKLFRMKQPRREITFLSIIVLLHLAIYVIFIFISQMAFSNRYFVPHFLLITLIVFWFIVTSDSVKRKFLFFATVIILEISGNLWIYPDAIAKSWDCTLAHVSFYELREDCFEYIDKNDINYDDVGAGFCLYGNRGFVELKNLDKRVNSGLNGKYFIYSNISNIPDDEFVKLTQSGKWKDIKKFERGFVKMIIYERN